MAFWKMVYDLGWVDIELLKQAVITDTNPYGDITKAEYKTITGKTYAK